MGITDEMDGEFDDSGGYDLAEIKKAKEALSTDKDVDTSGMVDVDPLYIEVIPHIPTDVFKTEEYEARVVVVEYNRFNEIIGVELL